MSERLHKLLAQHGIGSRREIEKWMLAGRILLNGQAAAPGDRYKPGDRVVIDGRDVTSRLQLSTAAQVLLYHKPQGQPIGASAAEAEESSDATVMESLPNLRGARWLVINTMQAGDSGLMLVTNDGRLADALRRRAETIPTAYVARVLVPTPDFDFESLPKIVQYDDEAVEFTSVEPAGGEGTNRWFRVESGRAHRRAAVRALFESRGLKVSRVIQVRFGDLELPRDLPRGRHRPLSDKQIASLYARAELERPIVTDEGAGRRRRSRGTPRRQHARKRPTGNRRSGR